MKKVLALTLVILALAFTVHAANTVTPSVTYIAHGKVALVTITWIDDATDGIASTQLTNGTGLPFLKPGYIIRAETDPGATAPDSNYDIFINSQYGTDLFGAALNNRSATANECAAPAIARNWTDGILYLVITGQTVDNATGTIYIYIEVVE